MALRPQFFRPAEQPSQEFLLGWQLVNQYLYMHAKQYFLISDISWNAIFFSRPER